MKKKSFANKILKLPLPIKERVFIFLRYISTPFCEIEKLVPEEAKILDVGCGHGLLELVLEKKGSQRLVVGIDPDKNKIACAKDIEPILEKTKFYNKSIFEINNNKFDCIIIADVDYLLNDKEKNKLFKKTKELLNRDGIMILKTVINDRSLGYYLSYLQEIFVVFLFKKTFTKNKEFHFLTVEEYERILKINGFEIKKQGKLKKTFYHPHYFFLSKK